MQSSNDNYASENDFLLRKAREILGEFNVSGDCSLLSGGNCPLMNSAMNAFITNIKKTETA